MYRKSEDYPQASVEDVIAINFAEKQNSNIIVS